MKSYLGIIKKNILKDIKSYSIVIFSLICSITLISIIFIVYSNEISRLNREIVSKYGNYDIYLNSITYDESKVLEGHNDVTSVSKVKFIGETEPEKLSDSKYKLQLLESDSNVFSKLFDLKLINGRLPKQDNECVISYKAMEVIGRDILVGETLEIPYVDSFGENKIYNVNVVGITESITPIIKENILYEENTGIAECIFIYKDTFYKDEHLYRVYASLSGEANEVFLDFNINYRNTRNNYSTRYGRPLNKSNYDFNGSVIKMNTPFSILMFSIVTLLVCINSISMIYKLKEKDLKNLTVIGANDRQIIIILLIEILIVWAISSFLSIAGIWLLFRKAIRTVLLSSIIILAINLIAFNRIYRSKKSKRELKYYFKEYDIEKRLAYSYYRNNMDRNKFAIRSIAISFLLIAMFLNQLLVASSKRDFDKTIEAQILCEKISTEFNESDIQELKDIDGVENVYLINEIYCVTGFPIIKMIDKQAIGSVNIEGDINEYTLLYNSVVRVIDDEVYNSYLNDEDTKSENGVIVDLSSIFSGGSYNGTTISEEQKIIKDEDFHLFKSNINDEEIVIKSDSLNIDYRTMVFESDSSKVVKIDKIMDRDIFNYSNLDDYIKIIMKESTAKELLGFNSYKMAYINVEDSKDQDVINKIIDVIQLNGDRYINLEESEKEQFKSIANNISMYIIMSLLLVALSLINTIITLIFNISARKRDMNLLRNIGMDDRQLRKMISYENYFVVGKSIYVGIVLSGIASFLTQTMFIRNNFELVIVWISVITLTAVFIIILTLVITRICISKKSRFNLEKEIITKM